MIIACEILAVILKVPKIDALFFYFRATWATTQDKRYAKGGNET